MKNILIAAMFFGAVSLNSCKDKEEPKPAESAITTFLTDENGISVGTRSSGPWELGVVFSASAPGKITELGSKMPEPGTYRVIVWDFDSKEILRQKTIEQTAPDHLTFGNIEALALTANKKYVISINSQSAGANKKYSYAYKTGSGNDFMPYTKGSILVHNACYKLIATASFPDQTPNVKYELYGLPEFTFIQD